MLCALAPNLLAIIVGGLLTGLSSAGDLGDGGRHVGAK